MEQKRVINILGRGIGMNDAPKENCWGVNIVILRRPVDVGFDMHEDGKMTQAQIDRRKEIIQRAMALDIPVYSVNSIPNTTYRRYPIEKVIQRFPTGYFSNAACYMIALALLEGVDELNFYGVNHLRTQPEYATQKGGVDYWLGVAMGLGVKCTTQWETAQIGRTEDNLAYGYQITAQEMIEKYGKH